VARWRDITRGFEALPSACARAPLTAQAARRFTKRVWSDDDLALLKELHASGLRAEQMAMRLGTNRSQLFLIMRNLGLTGQRTGRCGRREKRRSELQVEAVRLRGRGPSQA